MKRRNLVVGMRGPDVSRVSKALVLGPGEVYTRQLGDAVLAWKYRIGLGERDVNTGMGLRAQALMFGEARRTPVEVARAKVRARFQLKRFKPAKDAAPKPGSLHIVPRSEWGARPSKYPLSHASWVGGHTWIHYTAQAGPRRTLAAECAQLRDIQAFHQGPARGWSDVGYGFLVAPSGRVFEGRGWNRVGAHCPGHNDEPSISFMLGPGEEPSVEALASARALIAKIGKPLKGHRDGFSTSCPGGPVVQALGL